MYKCVHKICSIRNSVHTVYGALYIPVNDVYIRIWYSMCKYNVYKYTYKYINICTCNSTTGAGAGGGTIFNKLWKIVCPVLGLAVGAPFCSQNSQKDTAHVVQKYLKPSIWDNPHSAQPTPTCCGLSDNMWVIG
jgi:hypothetical protein